MFALFETRPALKQNCRLQNNLRSSVLLQGSMLPIELTPTHYAGLDIQRGEKFLVKLTAIEWL